MKHRNLDQFRKETQERHDNFLNDSPFYRAKKEMLLEERRQDEFLENAAILLRMGGNPCDASKIPSRINEDDIDVRNEDVLDFDRPKKSEARVNRAVALLRRAR